MTAAFALETPDLDQAREVVARVIGPFSLTPCRRTGYQARVRAGRVGAIGLAAVSYQAAVDIRSAAPDNALTLEIPVAGCCCFEQRETVFRAGRGGVQTTLPGRSIRTRMGDQARALVVRIPATVLAPAGQWGRDAIESRGWTPLQSLRPDRLASVERLAGLIFDETAAGGVLASDDPLGVELQQVLLGLLSVAGRGPRRAQPSADATSIVPRSVRRAQALMMAESAGGMTLPALANRCGISIRTLQDNFRQFIGTTPSEWWRGYRLDRVHTALRAGGLGTTVTDTAMAFGFGHLGRFAAQYRSRFGALPSETLRQARQEAQ